MMRKSLKRVLDRLRSLGNSGERKGTIGPRRAAGTAAHRRASRARSRAAVGAARMRTAIVSTYPPRACGIGTFAADLRGTLLGGRPASRGPTSSRS